MAGISRSYAIARAKAALAGGLRRAHAKDFATAPTMDQYLPGAKSIEPKPGPRSLACPYLDLRNDE